jgi:hypothetical protein
MLAVQMAGIGKKSARTAYLTPTMTTMTTTPKGFHCDLSLT